MTDEMKYAEINGIRTRYRIRGKGFPLIFVHGLMGCIEQEDNLAGEKARLAEFYRVMHYDCRGRGQSGPGELDVKYYTWDNLAGDLWELMKHVGIDRAHFIGGSMGASIVTRLALDRPEAVASLVLHNPVELRAHSKKYYDGIIDYAGFIVREGMQAVTDLILNLPPNDRLQKTHPGIINFYRQVMLSQKAEVVAMATKGLVCSKPMTREDLAKIQAPALVIAAEGDGLHPTETGKFIVDSIPNAEGYFADTLTYFSDNPELVPQKILEFFSRIDGIKW